jgi:hypothetical protein
MPAVPGLPELSDQSGGTGVELRYVGGVSSLAGPAGCGGAGSILILRARHKNQKQTGMFRREHGIKTAVHVAGAGSGAGGIDFGIGGIESRSDTGVGGEG